MLFPFYFFKSGPSDHVMKFVAGKLRKEGQGLYCLVGPRTTIATVPTTDQSVSFNFTELTSDGQQVVVQGEVMVGYLVKEIIERRDFTIDPRTGDYLSEDPERVLEEITHVLQSFVRDGVKQRTLKDSLAATAELEEQVLDAALADVDSFKDLGVEVKNLFVTGITPANPDLKKALEAEKREEMLAAADKALADRRKKAAESDRSLKEYESETAKRLEEERAKLVTERNKNLLAEAEAEAEATRKRLAPYASLAPGMVLALGIKEIAASGRVAQFTFTPEILAAVNAASRNGAGEKSRG